ncbi:MAG TPA: TldD/PmbA family protein [Vicinamibacteria bacterium]|nr:TldD/PmbA family protein [Vicinamibacteria bacterium]
MDYQALAEALLRQAQGAGADAADLLIAEGTEFSVTVRKGQVETLKEAGSKALGLRVFVGKRTASSYTSDFSPPALSTLVRETVAMAKVTGEDPAAGLPEETVPASTIELGLYDPAPSALPTPERIERARRAEAAAFAASPEITNSQGATYASGEGSVVLANTLGFRGGYRSSSVSLSVVPQAQRDGQMERDYWYTAGRGLSDLETPEHVGEVAAERTRRRLGARKVPTCEVPVVFDPETAAEILGTLFSALSGYSVFRNATFLKDKIGETVASPLLTLVDDGRRLRGLGSRPFDGEGLPTRRNVPLERGVLKHYLCDSYSARKIGARSTGSARRGIGGGPSVGASNLYFEAGVTPPEEILGGVEKGLYVTDLIGFGVDLVSGDYSQGAVGHWIEKGRLVHPVHEVTIAGNLKTMLKDVDAVGSDLEFRGASAAPTLRIRKMTISGS